MLRLLSLPGKKIELLLDALEREIDLARSTGSLDRHAELLELRPILTLDKGESWESDDSRLTVGGLRTLLDPLPAPMPIMPVMNECPSDNLSVSIDSITATPTYLEILVSVIDTEDEDEDDEDDEDAAEFVRDILASVGGAPGGCYIAVMSPGHVGRETWHLEVETADGVIGGVWDTGLLRHDDAAARAEADWLQIKLEAAGFTVYETREEWEASWEDEDDAAE